MAVPRNRSSNARKNSRRAHHAKTPKQLHKCPQCKGGSLPHRLCMHCGYYAGRLVIGGKQDAS